MRRMLPARWLATQGAESAAPTEPIAEWAPESRRRIRVATTIGASAYLFFLLIELSGALGGSVLERTVDRAHDLAGLTLCVAALVLTLWRRVPDGALLPLAIGLELGLATVISTLVPWAAFLRTGHLPALTWVVPIVILFPLLVPAPPATTLLASLACALTMPAGIAVLAATGRVSAHASDYWGAGFAGAVGAAIAVAASRTVYGARRDVAAARRMGSYELEELLGRGGMGEVWKARHQMLARPAAVKLILPERLHAPAEAREAALQRFTREARVTAGLRSPHTVQLYDFGVSADGVFYYAMELLEGMNLEHFVYRHGPVEPRRAVHWLRQACHSLAEAHARGLTHRDLKPANLFVCTYGRERDFLKVLDFGLARASAGDGNAALTHEGGWLGTPGWMAPEQILGGAAEPSADLYSMGCVAYWMLAGVRPFESDSVPELHRLHLQATPARPAERSPHAIPPALEQVVFDCLAKEPSRRPRDADELAERLAGSMPGDAWSPADAEEWWRRQASAP